MDLLLLIHAAGQVYILVLIARVIFSWLPPRYRATEIYGFLYKATEPLLRPIREILPTPGGIDFSPIVAILLIEVILGVMLP